MNVTHFFIICSTLIKQPNDYRENDTLRKKNIFLLFYDIFYAKIILGGTYEIEKVISQS